MTISKAVVLLLGLGLVACASSPPEYRMIPTADHGAGVRFSRGNAAMVSNGPSGSVMLLPVRYNASNRLYFALAAFNTSGRPINLGTEDVRVYLEDGPALRIPDFNYLRQEARRDAERAMAAAWVGAGIEGYLACQQAADHPRRTEIAFRRASGELKMSSAAIDLQLRHAISERGRLVLQTTTVDPGRTTAGFIFADQVLTPTGGVRSIVVDVNFGGAAHRFHIVLAASDSSVEVATNIPAVPAQTMQGMQRTPETWHWTNGPSSAPYDGLEVID
ncbi:MAG: hypothetical protein KF910_12420 [Brevundimonas sp.]|nr:hypothetical protein [Brevundimonas sp.]